MMVQERIIMMVVGKDTNNGAGKDNNDVGWKD